MGDCDNHSLGIWRTFNIYGGIQEISGILKLLREANLSFSFQIYGKHAVDLDHVAFRVSFPDVESLAAFRKNLAKELKNTPFRYEEKSCDMEYWMKKAYELGTKMALELRFALHDLSGVNIPMFTDIMVHGFYNNLGYGYLREVEEHQRMINHCINAMKGM